jgi:D-arabinose 1-dehydrogenase-like Zn-dependent alcohol dehydrogenase
MPNMRAVQVSKRGGPLELVELPVPEPAQGEVRVKVEACGVCHSDVLAKEGLLPGAAFPRIPGHEVMGVVDAVARDVRGFREGDRVGIGWNGGYCGACDPCRRGLFFGCTTSNRITGINRDGGYAEYACALSSALARVPDGLASIDAAPLMCAGLTTYNALRNSGARPGDLVAILGIGGLGHLGVQFAARMGFRTVAIARGADKAPLAKELGAQVYLDSEGSDAAAELKKLGGARVIAATVTNGEAMSAVMGGLGPAGTFMILGAPESLTIHPGMLIGGRQSLVAWYSGTSIDSQDTLAFSALSGVRSMNEVYPLERAAEAYERMLSGKARFRVVLKVR